MASKKTIEITHNMATKIWDAMFALRWAEVHPGHPLRPLMEKLIRSGYGTDEARQYVESGQVEPAVVNQLARAKAVAMGVDPDARQDAPEEYGGGPGRGDPRQLEGMHHQARATGTPTSGSF